MVAMTPLITLQVLGMFTDIRGVRACGKWAIEEEKSGTAGWHGLYSKSVADGYGELGDEEIY